MWCLDVTGLTHPCLTLFVRTHVRLFMRVCVCLHVCVCVDLFVVFVCVECRCGVACLRLPYPPHPRPHLPAHAGTGAVALDQVGAAFCQFVCLGVLCGCVCLLLVKSHSSKHLLLLSRLFHQNNKRSHNHSIHLNPYLSHNLHLDAGGV